MRLCLFSLPHSLLSNQQSLTQIHMSNSPKQQRQSTFSKGGFGGLNSRATYDYVTAEEIRRKREEAKQERAAKITAAKDEKLLKLATVSMNQWEIEKEKRVKVAFDRIIEHEWFDKFEGNLKLAEQRHINAVREHFAMRRDRIKTPDAAAQVGVVASSSKTNVMSAFEWADNIHAMDQLGMEGSFNLQQRFLKMAAKKAAQHQKNVREGAMANRLEEDSLAGSPGNRSRRAQWSM